MKKTFLLALLASLLLLPACKNDSKTDPTKGTAKGIIDLNFTISGYAKDVLAVRMTINDDTTFLFTQSTTTFRRNDIDPNVKTTISFKPVFLSDAAPAGTDKFDFICKLSGIICVSEDDGVNWNSSKPVDMNVYLEGVNPKSEGYSYDLIRENVNDEFVGKFVIENGTVTEIEEE